MSKWDITGIWDGEYRYDVNDRRSDMIPNVPFSLTAHRGWFGRFKGVIQDNPRQAAIAEARICGTINSEELTFFKQYPVFYVMSGPNWVTLKQSLEQNHGLSLDHELIPPPIVYQGYYDKNDESVRGTWRVEAQLIQFWSQGQSRKLPCKAYSGSWTMRRRKKR